MLSTLTKRNRRLVMFTGIKRALFLEKSSLELQLSKSQPGYPCSNVFLELFRPNKFFMTLCIQHLDA